MYTATDTGQDALSRQILETASGLYLKYGLKKVTMDDISKAIGKSRSSIYYYYKNREEIFQAVMDSLLAAVVDEIGAAIRQAKSLQDKIQAFCLVKIKTSEERKTFFTAIEAGMDVEEKSRHAQIIVALHKRLMKAEAALIKNIIAEHIKSKEIRSLKPKEQETAIFILLSSIRGIRREMTLDDDFSNMHTTVNILVRMVLNWLRS